MRRVLSLFCAASVAAGLPSALHGQAGRTLRGRVIAAGGEPVAEAIVRLLEPTSGRLTFSSATGRFELFASCRVGGAVIVLAVDNLFDVDWNEAQFATTSRLRNESAPVTELHFTPGARRSVQLGAGFRF